MFDRTTPKSRVQKDLPPRIPIVPVIPPLVPDDPPPVDLTNGPVETDKPPEVIPDMIVMPDLLAGTPPRWFLCAKHPELCPQPKETQSHE
jgi:hypothetical protein